MGTHWIGPPYLTHSDWWALPATERDERVRQARRACLRRWRTSLPIAINGRPFVFYEAQQPPLFYWMASARDAARERLADS